MISRAVPQATPEAVFTKTEIELLDRLDLAWAFIEAAACDLLHDA
ncbi:hypothetical protein OKW40_004872 [Paraburkholderia sp. RAU6.4a]